MKNINLKRLKTTLVEYWLLNKGKIVSIPVVVFVLYILAMFWYGTPLFNRLFLNGYSEGSFAEALANYTGKQTTNLVLFILPLYLILCTVPYFKMLTKTVRGSLSPVSRGERMLTLWLGNLTIIFLILFSFFLTDLAFVSVMKSLYLADAISYKESVGELYFKFKEKTYFSNSEPQIYTAAIIASCIFACLYQLAAIFFRKYSIPLFALLLIALGVFYFKVIVTLHQHADYHFEGSDLRSKIMTLYILLVLLGIIVTTYFKLREKEIY
ncbi:hypothetical protein M8998_05760 [Sphingobacterium sp. lm-10]|uniref:hypothetical protein n=1 Tax=Sphingobacterium sp. lm-10 TaxID=2944904 RepID=UPI00201FF7B5|nr:hypothetical protein [Sphingobacterium sp. lm-10]MCL7987442.1 hypothetical protein [Sphingobacterium sp. lm-10]